MSTHLFLKCDNCLFYTSGCAPSMLELCIPKSNLKPNLDIKIKKR